MSDKFEELDRVLDSESWDFLNDNYPALAISVQKMVDRSISAADIKRRVIQRVGAHREPLAARCENAARYLEGTKK